MPSPKNFTMEKLAYKLAKLIKEARSNRDDLFFAGNRSSAQHWEGKYNAYRKCLRMVNVSLDVRGRGE